MAIDIDEVRRRIDLDEPDYEALAAALGPQSIPHLLKLVASDDAAVASKATYLLSLFDTPQAVEGVEAAAKSADTNVRAAAAAAMRNLRGGSGVDTFRRLLSDPDPGVRKVALRSARASAGPAVRAEIERIAREDPEDGLRSAARAVLGELG
ncbi:MAG: HEAT repeat domain-containing protein [Actinomycetota bacterium]|nr:HEAT repeat domain-containing protein [Actinomycetota bacterium]